MAVYSAFVKAGFAAYFRFLFGGYGLNDFTTPAGVKGERGSPSKIFYFHDKKSLICFTKLITVNAA